MAKIAISEAVRQRAREAAALMREGGQQTVPFPLTQVEPDGGVSNMGVLSVSPHGMIPVGEVTVGGAKYYIGLPLDK